MTNFAGGWGYPQGQAPYGAPAAPPVPARPRTVMYAVWLMYAGAALSVVNGLVDALMAHSLVTTMFTQFENQEAGAASGYAGRARERDLGPQFSHNACR